MSDRPGPRGTFYILAAVAIAIAISATIGPPASDAQSVAGLHKGTPAPWFTARNETGRH